VEVLNEEPEVVGSGLQLSNFEKNLSLDPFLLLLLLFFFEFF